MRNGFALLLVLIATLSFAQTVDPRPVPETETEVETVEPDPLPETEPEPVPEPTPVNSNQIKLDSIKNITRFAFGSCNNQNQSQPLWKDMQKTKPDVFIWNGDIIYADWENNYNIKASYQKQKNHAGYTKVREQTPILGLWDDHDYAWNDADGTNSKKRENQKLLLDFLDEPLDSARRTREGIYTSYEFGEEGKRVKFILLDNRFHKNLETSAPMLGNKQWQWLEQELKNSTAQVHFIMTGLSIFSPLLPYSEEWWHYPSEVNRMLKLVKTYKPKGLAFLTGDKHFGSIFKSYGQLEMISSGMTHVISSRAWWYLNRKFPITWFGLNYGMIDIAWEGTNPLITMSFRTYDGRDVHKQKYRWGKDTWDRMWQ